jgi:SAM-dependent methyltransferase
LTKPRVAGSIPAEGTLTGADTDRPPRARTQQNAEVEAPSSSDAFDPRSYWEARLRDNLGPSGVGCLGLANGYNRWLSRVRAVAVRRALRFARPDWRGASVLDIGSGTGYWIEQWRHLGVESVAGSDFTTEAVERLRLRWGANAIHELDVGTDALSVDGPFDGVSAIDVFFHIVDDDAYARAWRNVASLLRPGGLFVLTENLLRDAPERREHLVSRTLADVLGWARDAGFGIVAHRPVFVLMNRPIDSTWRPLHRWWRGLERVASHEWLGYAAGAALFPIEVTMASALHDGPSTEILICRRST